MGQLKEWAKENSPFLKLGDGETFQGKYLGYSAMLDQYGKEGKVFKFQTVAGKQKTLQSRCWSLIEAFDEEGTFKIGDFVKLTRHGKEKQTKYIVEPGDIVI